MNEPLRFLLCPLVALVLSAPLCCGATVPKSPAEPCGDALKAEFQTPPQPARPWVYWFWYDGSVTPEGITKDLEAFRKQGVGGVLIYQCDSLPRQYFKQNAFWSPDWVKLVEHSQNEAKRLGLELGLFICSTSSGMGGPWIDAEHSGQIIVWSGARVNGGGKRTVALPQPEIRENFYRDVQVVAYPVKSPSWDAMRLAAPAVRASSTEWAWSSDGERAVDGDPDSTWTSLPRGDKGESLDFSFATPFSAVALYLVPRDGWSPGTVEVQTSSDGNHYETVATQKLTPRLPATVPFPPSASRYYRVKFQGSEAKDGRMGLKEARLLQAGEDGARALGSFALFSQQMGNASHTREGIRALMQMGEIQAGGPVADFQPEQAVDVTRFMDAKGQLTWEAPAGEWEILRFGHTCLGPTARINTEPHGYHLDYLDASTIKIHFEKGVDPLLKQLGSLKGSAGALKILHEDSFEVPYNRWTGIFPREFKKRRGYDLTPWMPVLAGRVAGSKGASERFLRDYRGTIADLYAEHFQSMRSLVNARGFQFSCEAGGPSFFCFDALAQLGRTDIPQGEFWTGIYQPGVPEEAQQRGWCPLTTCGIVRQVASASHIYGQPLAAAESFTGYSRPFALDPYMVKAVGDRAFCDGLNRNVIHLSVSQPLEELDGKPCVVRIHAIDYNRRCTWFDQSAFWMDYLGRCSYLLQQGKAVADVLYFVGECAPAFVPDREFMEPKMPAQYDYDGINREQLLTARVENGRIVLPTGASYAVLVLPPAQLALSPELLRHLKSLVGGGAVILGRKPAFASSLLNAAESDREVKALAGELWGSEDAPCGEHPFGKGMVVWGKSIAEVLKRIKCGPAFEAVNASEVMFANRRTNQAEIFFVSNQSNKEVAFTGRFRANPGAVPELWNPATGACQSAAVYNEGPGCVEIPIQLPPSGSVFVVLRKAPGRNPWVSVRKDGQEIGASSEVEVSQNELTAWSAGSYELQSASGAKRVASISSVPAALDLSTDWEVVFKDIGARHYEHLLSWTDSPEAAIKYYSGKAVYKKSFDWSGPDCRVDLDLGSLKNIAEVRLNGQPQGLLWKPPTRLEITRALKQGRNELEIEITNLLLNRIVGDFLLPPEKRHMRCFGAVEQYRATTGQDQLPAAGLFGPVKLLPAVTVRW